MPGAHLGQVGATTIGQPTGPRHRGGLSFGGGLCFVFGLLAGGLLFKGQGLAFEVVHDPSGRRSASGTVSAKSGHGQLHDRTPNPVSGEVFTADAAGFMAAVSVTVTVKVTVTVPATLMPGGRGLVPGGGVPAGGFTVVVAGREAGGGGVEQVATGNLQRFIPRDISFLVS